MGCILSNLILRYNYNVVESFYFVVAADQHQSIMNEAFRSVKMAVVIFGFLCSVCRRRLPRCVLVVLYINALLQQCRRVCFDGVRSLSDSMDSGISIVEWELETTGSVRLSGTFTNLWCVAGSNKNQRLAWLAGLPLKLGEPTYSTSL